jgi:hypothetical protein
MPKLKINYNLVKERAEYALAIILISIVAISIAYFILRPSYTPSPITDSSNQSNGPEVNFIDINDTKQLEVSGKKITLPDGYNATLAFSNYSESNMKCLGDSDCNIFLISNDKTEFYLSTPVAITQDIVKNATTIEKKEVDLGSQKVEFNWMKLKTYDIQMNADSTSKVMENTTDPVIYNEISGCLGRVCLSSGLLSTNSVDNQKQIVVFTDFLKQLKID